MATVANAANNTVTNNANVGLSSPWMELFRKIEAMFKEDEAVNVSMNNDTKVITLNVSGTTKTKAIRQLLPESVPYGNITVKIEVNEVDDFDASDILKVYKQAFAGNGAFVTTAVNEILGMKFVVFAKEVVQYFNDDLGDVHGLRSTLYQEIAKEIFTNPSITDDVHFCTDNSKE